MLRRASLLVGLLFSLVAPASGAELAPAQAPLPKLPEAISSFGAAVSGDALYVYGGHTGDAHAHSKENLSLRFSRLKLDAPSEWESLPVGPGLQSPALVAHDGKIYRIGGLTALNAPKEPENLVSLADFERFDPQTKQWEKLASLPEARSSHDAVVVGNLLYVMGGWNLGKDQKWHDTALVADLSQAKPEWKELPKQPFKRRALAVAEHGGKIYAIGGMSEKSPTLDVHYYDPKTQTWSEGPKVNAMAADGPMGKVEGMNGFGCSAFGVDGKLYLSTMDGNVFTLADDGQAWTAVAKLEKPRFFHRLLPHGHQLLAIGGAARGGHLDTIERVNLAHDRK
jgi:N-acetylneuraminic acid mutarotase